MLADVDLGSAVILLGIATVSSGLYYMVQSIRHEQRIRRTGGVRAPQITSYPGQAMINLREAAKATRENRLMEMFNGFFDRANPKGPEAVEVQLLGRQRYIITRDPEHIKTILTSKFSDFGKGEDFHRIWKPFLGDSIFTTDGQMWQQSRSLIRPMFITEKVSDLDTFDRWAQQLITKIPTNGAVVDIMDLFYRMTLDVTTDFLLGATTDSLNNPRNEFTVAFNDIQTTMTLLTTIGPLERFVPRGKLYRDIAKLDEFVMPFIQQALNLPQSELDKLSKADKGFTFLHSVARQTRDPQVLRDQIVAVLLAGRDTTAATLSWAFYELSNKPAIWRRLRSEVLDAVGPGGTPSYENLKNMTFLRHTISETLRLYPAVPYNLRTALHDTTLPSSRDARQAPIGVLAGDNVIYSAFVMQRRPELYPPVSDTFAHPAVFSPERWEHWTPSHWQYVPFNGGPRICVGQNFALTEIAFCMVRILQKYERIEYAGDSDWAAQQHVAEIVGRPSEGVRIRMFESGGAAASHYQV
ncbi:cytochrome P450 [Microdochium trichocladiopsis]|uniref:Cytochrome P450 n=1 Tax=Microdochium trichocladiopsis TaxID=1682393 RepID=A0A9P8Y841_9PEZI|nr:cytochrome P450 [Microdochium trichocladiopsis]KAH7031603.1 cytochrome P450 [Microdochium trichocladiopsis]